MDDITCWELAFTKPLSWLAPSPPCALAGKHQHAEQAIKRAEQKGRVSIKRKGSAGKLT
jgi:hypothetical protein